MLKMHSLLKILLLISKIEIKKWLYCIDIYIFIFIFAAQTERRLLITRKREQKS